MFFKIASVPILGVYKASGKFIKTAKKTADIDQKEDVAVKKALNLISPEVLKAIAGVYNLSANINDYIFPIPRAVSADQVNSNGDLFQHEELSRFSPPHKCLVYQTFTRSPLHIEHASEDPKSARGFVIDSHYIQDDIDDRFVITVVAVDTTKDPPLASALLDGTVESVSMGCVCDEVQCSYCNKVAKSDHALCDHLRWHKMATIDGELIYEKCLGVEFQELSVVGDPADPKAVNQMILQYAAARQIKQDAKHAFNILSSLVDPKDQHEVARFFKENVNRLPEPMLRLANKLL